MGAFNKRGFTLLELAGVLAIMGALAMYLIPMLNKTEERQRLNFSIQQVEKLSLALDKYYMDYCGQATFPQPTVAALEGQGYLSQPLVMPAYADNVITSVSNPNTARSFYSIVISYNDEVAAERIEKLSDNADRPDLTTVRWRSLTPVSREKERVRERLDKELYDLTGC